MLGNRVLFFCSGEQPRGMAVVCVVLWVSGGSLLLPTLKEVIFTWHRDGDDDEDFACSTMPFRTSIIQLCMISDYFYFIF